ncbi:hypothetical protein OROGR_006182 [Orobanche gracilis]
MLNSREMFNKWQAQRWWSENSEKIIELYNVQRLNPQAFPHPTTPSSEDGTTTSKTESIGNSPVTPPLDRELLPRSSKRHLSSDSSDLQSAHSCGGIGSTPKLSSISGGGKTETSSMEASTSSTTTSSSRGADRSGEISISNASDSETEWVEQDEPGVYITMRALPDGRKEIKRVRFSKSGRNSGSCMLEYGGKRIERGYINNTCDRD